MTIASTCTTVLALSGLASAGERVQALDRLVGCCWKACTRGVLADEPGNHAVQNRMHEQGDQAAFLCRIALSWCLLCTVCTQAVETSLNMLRRDARGIYHGDIAPGCLSAGSMHSRDMPSRQSAMESNR